MEVPHWSRLLVEGTVTCISLISLYLNREQEAASVRLTLAYICTMWPYLKTGLGSAHPTFRQRRSSMPSSWSLALYCLSTPLHRAQQPGRCHFVSARSYINLYPRVWRQLASWRRRRNLVRRLVEEDEPEACPICYADYVACDEVFHHFKLSCY